MKASRRELPSTNLLYTSLSMKESRQAKGEGQGQLARARIQGHLGAVYRIRSKKEKEEKGIQRKRREGRRNIDHRIQKESPSRRHGRHSCHQAPIQYSTGTPEEGRSTWNSMHTGRIPVCQTRLRGSTHIRTLYIIQYMVIKNSGFTPKVHSREES